uniref:Conopeptide im001 n=1 Tax=Conus imperialis TaxID=35631 RepID=A0A125S9D5_CONIM|nr:conopeptide im001 [Conus imperialis]DAZ86127.1 TPA_inf: conotoxin precursor A [Conus ebraeus]
MGMRMMFTVFLLVVLATTVVPITLASATDGRNAAADARMSPLISKFKKDYCHKYGYTIG